MANDKKDFVDVVKQCKVLLLDVEGTTTSISFVKDKLYPYAEKNVKQFLDSKWEQDDVKEVVNALRKLALEDKENSVDGVVSIPGEDSSKDDQIEAVVKNVKWQMSLDRKASALKQLQGLIWKQGYDNGDIKGHVYDDVSPALEQWRATEGQKVYIYSSGSVQAQKLLFGQSLAGDLLKYIDGHFDTSVGAKRDSASYKTIAEKIDCKSEEILFLTDIVQEAEAARSAGVQVAIVSREGNAPLSEEEATYYPVINSFARLTVNNKRKPEAQMEIPAKVMKTDADKDIKATLVNSCTVDKEPAKEDNKQTEPEKMEVEDVAESSNEEKPVKVETVVEEITESNETEMDTSVCDIQPIIEEKSDDSKKTEEKEIDAIETEVSEKKVESSKDHIANVENTAQEDSVAEEIPVTVVTEIEELTNDNPSIPEVAEPVDEIVPVIEEPNPAEDTEALKNIGECLEKECDQILSKVQDITNIENLPVKSVLNTIEEESMETESVDSNNVSEKISNKESEGKQNVDVDKKTNTVVEEQKVVEDISENASEKKDNIVVENVEKDENKVNSIPEADELKSSVEEDKTKDSSVVTDSIKESVEENGKESEAKEGAQVNGKVESNVNEAKKNEELNKRLSVENGKETVNGSNGDAHSIDQSEGDCKDSEVKEIKVKTIVTDESRNDPIEQPAEA